MWERKKLLVFVAAGALALGAAVASASTESGKATEGAKAVASRAEKKSGVRRVRGEVTAVEPAAKTMVVKAMEGKLEVTVGVDISDKTIIREGKTHKTLADIKVGDKVWMKYERTNDRLIAHAIRILKPARMAAKSKAK